MEHKAHARIDKERITTDWQVSYWAMKLGQSEDAVEEAIDDVGDRIADVRQYFFCGPPMPARATSATPKVRKEENVRQPILDWLCSPSLCGLENLRMHKLA